VIYDSTNEAYWKTQSFWPGTQVSAVSPSELEGSQLTVQFNRTVEAGLDEDRAMFRIHLAVDAGPGANTVALTNAQAQQVEDNFQQAWTSHLGALVQNRWTQAEFVWRNFGAAYPLDETGASKPGPIWRVTPLTNPGTSIGTALPDQLAATVTYRTPSRKHWGRSYWGGLSQTAFSGESYGKLADTYVTELAAGFHQWMDANSNEASTVNLWVWSPRHRGVLSVTQISVDDVPDIVRRRRAKNASFRATHP
jgi:hypothetical protein